MTIVYRRNLNRPMSWDELDGNFEEVERIGVQSQQYATSASTSAASSASSASLAQQQVIVASGEADRAKSEADRAATIAAEIDSGFGGQYRNLSVNVSGVGYQGTIAAERLVVESEFFAITVLRNISLSFDAATSGAGGLDTGSVAAGNWYYIYVIYNETSAAAILSLNGSTPALPSGYTKWSMVGVAVVPPGSQRFLKTFQSGRVIGYVGNDIPTVVNNSSATTLTYVDPVMATPPITKEVTYLKYSTNRGSAIYYPSTYTINDLADTSIVTIVETGIRGFWYKNVAGSSGYAVMSYRI